MEPPHATLDLVAQVPGTLQLTVLPSQERASIGQTSPWWVAVQLRNDGEEPLVLRAPRATDLEFRHGGLVQSDYIVAAPDSLEEGGLVLDGGSTGTLRYRIARTGGAGGSVMITAALTAAHANDPSAPAATAAALE